MIFVFLLVIAFFIYFIYKKCQDKDSSEYTQITLKDNKTIQQHINESYMKQALKNSKEAKKTFPKELEKQYQYILSNMECRSNKYPSLTIDEEFIIKTFLEKVSLIRKNYTINIIRFGNGMIRIEYNGYPTGQFNLQSEYYVRILRGMQIVDKDNVTYEEIISAVDSWVRYCKYQLKDFRI